MSEPAGTTTLAAWLETAGPKRCIMWIAETCDEIAVRDVPEWKFWLEMGSLLRDVAAALPAYNDTTATDDSRCGRRENEVGEDRKRGQTKTMIR